MACKYLRNNICIFRNNDCNINAPNCKMNLKTYTTITPQSGTSKELKEKKLKQVFIYEEKRYGYNMKIDTVDFQDEIHTVYIFRGDLNIRKENVIDTYALIFNQKTKRAEKILLAYNKRSKKYYMSETQMNYYFITMKKWLKIKIMMSEEGTEDWGKYGNEFSWYRQFSILKLYGYTVGRNGLKDYERQNIISFVLDNGLMTKHEIISLLQGHIYRRRYNLRGNYNKAINDWKKDIMFIEKYRRV